VRHRVCDVVTLEEKEPVNKLAIGVIGLGLGRHHAAYAQDEAVGRLVLCDADPHRLAQIRAELPGVAAAYRDIDDMFAAERLDAVSIVTPDHLHCPHAEACLRAGCHVLLTKPLATNLEDGRAIVRQAEAAGRKLMVAHERRFRKHVLRIKALLDAGELGEIVHLRIDPIQPTRKVRRTWPFFAAAT
jgi:predicted dehydrogenase